MDKHPAQKPIALLKKIITIASNPGDIIFDPFMGVGSIGVAAVTLKRRFIGVDINHRYYYAAKQRIETEISKNVIINENIRVIEEPNPNYNINRICVDESSGVSDIEIFNKVFASKIKFE